MLIRVVNKADVETEKPRPWSTFTWGKLFRPKHQDKAVFARATDGAVTIRDRQGKPVFVVFSDDELCEQALFNTCVPVKGFSETIEFRSDDDE